MSQYPINHCPDVELTQLPHDDVKTHDGHVLKLGSIAYFRYTPGRAATEYVVVSDRATRHNDRYMVIVVGPRGNPSAMDPYDLVHDANEWWKFRQRRYGHPANRS